MKRSVFLSEFHPFIRVATDVVIHKDKKSQTVCASDHRLFYVKSGSATVTFCAEQVRILEGTALFFLSGVPYRIQPDIHMDLDIIAVNFDLLNDHCQMTSCLPLIPAERYNPADQLELLEIKDVPELNSIICVPEAQPLLPLFQQLVIKKREGSLHHEQICANLLQAILLTLCSPAQQPSQNDHQKHSCRDILAYLQTHYAEDLTNSTLAKVFNYHPSYISQLICEQTGSSLHQQLLHIRIQQALRLLQATDISIHEISQMVGFRDVSYFSQYFKKCTGYPPSKYRAGL